MTRELSAQEFEALSDVIKQWDAHADVWPEDIALWLAACAYQAERDAKICEVDLFDAAYTAAVLDSAEISYNRACNDCAASIRASVADAAKDKP